jgi:trigger factor
MRTTAQPLEANKVKLSIQLDEVEVERAIESAYRRMAREVRIPGFRPGRVPRRVLEARLGADRIRGEALADAIPNYFSAAVRDADLDVISQPEIEITDGKESGPVSFDAVVEVRPRIELSGYREIRVEMPSPVVKDEEVEEVINALRERLAEPSLVERPAQQGDQVVIDIEARRGDSELRSLSAKALAYRIGSGDLIEGLDEALEGISAGEERSFEAAAYDGKPASFKVRCHQVSAILLPELTDEWVAQHTEYKDVADFRARVREGLASSRRANFENLLKERTMEALLGLVSSEPPQAMVDSELAERIRSLEQELEAHRIPLKRFLSARGYTEEQLVEELRREAVRAAKADLALRALADAESIEVADDELDQEIRRAAERSGLRTEELRERMRQGGSLNKLRSELRKAKAFEWLVGHVEVVDETGKPIDRKQLKGAEAATFDTGAEASEPEGKGGEAGGQD